MDIIQRLAPRLVAGIVGLAVLGLAARAAAQDNDSQLAAKILRVHGLARWSTDNHNWHPAKPGDILNPGTVVQTAEKSSLDIFLDDRKRGRAAPISYNLKPQTYTPEGPPPQNRVRMFERTVLAINKSTKGFFTGTEEIELDLRAGRIMGSVKKLSAASKYEVKIPNGIARIQGGAYMISSSGVVNVLMGSVNLAYVSADGNAITKLVPAGYSWDPQTGQLTPLEIPEEPIYTEPSEPVPTPPITYTPPSPPGLTPSPINVTPQENQGLSPSVHPGPLPVQVLPPGTFIGVGTILYGTTPIPPTTYTPPVPPIITPLPITITPPGNPTP